MAGGKRQEAAAGGGAGGRMQDRRGEAGQGGDLLEVDAGLHEELDQRDVRAVDREHQPGPAVRGLRRRARKLVQLPCVLTYGAKFSAAIHPRHE